MRAVHAIILSLAIACSGSAQGPAPSPWTRSFGVGVALTQGNSETSSVNVSFTGQFDDRRGRNAKTEVLYLRTASNDSSRVEKLTASGRFERALSPRLFWFGELASLRDTGQAIAALVTPTGGAGFQLVRSEARTLSVDASAGIAVEHRAGDARTTAGALRAGQQFECRLSPVSRLTQKLTALWKGGHSRDALYRLDAGVTSKITTATELKLSYLFDYRRQPPAGIRNADRALFATLVYKF